MPNHPSEISGRENDRPVGGLADQAIDVPTLGFAVHGA
jgi:hypothetical protein